MPDGTKLKLPPVILGTLGNDPRKPTVCIYGHLDVQPALKSDGWDTDPFELILKDEKLYGRGSTDDKGPAIAWLHVVEAYKNTKCEIPVNLKVVTLIYFIFKNYSVLNNYYLVCLVLF